MTEKTPQNPFVISRRTTLQMALATLLAGRVAGFSQSASAQDIPSDTWNWGGNAGHTGELPGPGLDLEGALGELWRLPSEEFGDGSFYGYDEREIAGSLNGVIYTWGEADNLLAWKLRDGSFLWAQSPGQRITPGTPQASPQAGDEGPRFDPQLGIAIDGDLVLVPLTNGQLWALDAMTGEFKWDFDSGSELIGAPTVVDHIAYCDSWNGVLAIELGDQPNLRWTADIGPWKLAGVDGGYVFVVGRGSDGDEIRALTTDDGSEYWRTSLGSSNRFWGSLGLSPEGLIIATYDDETSTSSLVVLDQVGGTAWRATLDYDRSTYGWSVGDTVTTLSLSDDDYGNHRMLTRFVENGNSNWQLEINASRWGTSGDDPVLCAGKAYALIRDRNQNKRLLIIVDPDKGEVVGSWESPFIPLFMAEGIMIARDRDSGEIVAIGTVPAVLQAGGRATVTKESILRGAPSTTAIERTTVAEGTLVDVTGASETAKETEWVPVYEHETGQNGWLPVDVLAGQDGSIRFSSINPYEFGDFTAYPKFSSGTRAEVTEQTVLRGAPSESSAKKATLEAGTLVTVTSPPTETDDGEWCPIKVDDTGESGWVPLSALALARNS